MKTSVQLLVAFGFFLSLIRCFPTDAAVAATVTTATIPACTAVQSAIVPTNPWASPCPIVPTVNITDFQLSNNTLTFGISYMSTYPYLNSVKCVQTGSQIGQWYVCTVDGLIQVETDAKTYISFSENLYCSFFKSCAGHTATSSRGPSTIQITGTTNNLSSSIFCSTTAQGRTCVQNDNISIPVLTYTEGPWILGHEAMALDGTPLPNCTDRSPPWVTDVAHCDASPAVTSSAAVASATLHGKIAQHPPQTTTKAGFFFRGQRWFLVGRRIAKKEGQDPVDPQNSTNALKNSPEKSQSCAAAAMEKRLGRLGGSLGMGERFAIQTETMNFFNLKDEEMDTLPYWKFPNQHDPRHPGRSYPLESVKKLAFRKLATLAELHQEDIKEPGLLRRGGRLFNNKLDMRRKKNPNRSLDLSQFTRQVPKKRPYIYDNPYEMRAPAGTWEEPSCDDNDLFDYYYPVLELEPDVRKFKVESWEGRCPKRFSGRQQW
ncbi:hypothetical protein G7Y89_g10165 [Cudoniella acicularis]|uniref:Uncharacterized protein n=1 Tax=Cudoniella acicularis TaxID=354080 RepID=A0A8H4RG16_9HELO|nr:hypothetical protein G7Y89_g10165 [Cudoniella acicularis]